MVTRQLVLGVSAALMVLAGCTTTGEPQAQPTTPRDGVFIHIKSGPTEPHAVLMGLRMAQIMAGDRDVLVYFDVDGIGVVLNDTEDFALAPFGSVQALLTDLAAKDVPLYACPGCLEAVRRGPEDLRPEIQVAEKDAFFGFTDGRILTLDY
jgi:predicted peroxiredoxin